MQETQYTPEQQKENEEVRKALHREFFAGDPADQAVKDDMDKRLGELETANHELVRRVKVGRNDPCPCGSGKKFKKCCIDRVGERVSIPQGNT